MVYDCVRVCLQVDLRHIDEARGTNVVELGVDLSEFYTSVEWDILEVPAVRFVSPSLRSPSAVCLLFFTCCTLP